MPHVYALKATARTRPNAVVIGETQDRVKKATRSRSAEVYSPVTLSQVEALRREKELIAFECGMDQRRDGCGHDYLRSRAGPHATR